MFALIFKMYEVGVCEFPQNVFSLYTPPPQKNYDWWLGVISPNLISGGWQVCRKFSVYIMNQEKYSHKI